MSGNYYLRCSTKRIYMPVFTISPGETWMASKNHVFDFILACIAEYLGESATDSYGNSTIDFAHEYDLDLLDQLFRDPRNPHPKDKLITSALEDEWHPMDTAPKDGTLVYLFIKNKRIDGWEYVLDSCSYDEKNQKWGRECEGYEHLEDDEMPVYWSE